MDECPYCDGPLLQVISGPYWCRYCGALAERKVSSDGYNWRRPGIIGIVGELKRTMKFISEQLDLFKLEEQ